MHARHYLHLPASFGATTNMHDEYNSQGDAIMRDASLPDPAMDQFAAKFTRCSLQDPPVYRVPDDLLYELFLTLAGEPSVENCDLTVLLSHVCANWRSIILRAPLLWKFVAMYSSGSPKDHSATIESFLHRSQAHSITFAAFVRKAPLSKSPFVRILHAHAPRVRSLRFTACSLPTLWSHLVNLSLLSLTSLEHHEAMICWGRRRTPGNFTAISRPALEHKTFRTSAFVPTAVPTWPCYLDLTSLSFMYSSLKLSDIFLVVEMAQSTLQHLKLYFQNRQNVVTVTHWLLMDGPLINLGELRSMHLGYNDPLSLVPFLHHVRIPSLDSLSIHDFGSCSESDTPPAKFVPLPAEPPTTPPVYPTPRPLDRFISALVEAIPFPELLTSLHLTGLDGYASTSLEYALDHLGPDLRALSLTKCSQEIFDAFLASVACGDLRWALERLTIRGMDADELQRCLWIRHAVAYGRLKVIYLERPLACREVLVEESDME